MKKSIRYKLERLLERNQELSELLSDASVIQSDKFKAYSQEYAKTSALSEHYQVYKNTQEALDEHEESLKTETCDEMRALINEELVDLKNKLVTEEETLQNLLLPEDPNDKANVYLEIRAGTGGDEAAIFVGDLFRMYSRYGERLRWRFEIISQNISEQGGFKELILKVEGNNVYQQLKFESGVHRVQRVPQTESQGRVHTSACTVAIMPEVETIDEVDINPADLKVDTYRSSGAGGQHVNTTDSAIRITHLPTGIVVECQDERSQHKNRARAMSLLQAKIIAEEQRKQQALHAETRKLQVGSGDRSERIRTYNFPQGRLTDHRINLTLYQLGDVIEGGLNLVIEPLLREHQLELLSQLEEDEAL